MHSHKSNSKKKKIIQGNRVSLYLGVLIGILLVLAILSGWGNKKHINPTQPPPINSEDFFFSTSSNIEESSTTSPSSSSAPSPAVVSDAPTRATSTQPPRAPLSSRSPERMPPPNYTTFTPPALGENFSDLAFGTNLRRLSDAEAEGVAWVSHAYSSVSPFNADATLVLLEKAGGVIHLRDLQGNIVQDNLDRKGIFPASDPRWSRSDPHLIYFHTPEGNEIKTYNVASGNVTTIATLEGFTTIRFGNGEGDISWDGESIPILADSHYITSFHTPTRSLSRTIDTHAYGPIDVVDVTSEDNLVFLAVDPSATWIVDRHTNRTPVKLLDYGGHSDRARDMSGTESLIITNSADSTPLPDCPNGIVRVDVDAAHETCLQPLDWSLAVHVSCNNANQAWCLISTYSNNHPDLSWPPYTNELLQVALDGTGVTRLAHTRSTNSSYERIPRAAVSPDGKYVLFASDMQGEYVDVYLLSVPDN